MKMFERSQSRLAATALIATLCLPAALRAQSDRPPGDSGVTEKVLVLLAEVQILVTDKRGEPILDLRPGEITVREGGRERELAYLEPFATSSVASRGT